MDFLIGSVAVVAIGTGLIIGYCQWAAKQDAKQQAAVDDFNKEINDEIQAAIQRRTEANRQRAESRFVQPFGRSENQFRIDDEQWRDWN
jgi:hypothetical protein